MRGQPQNLAITQIEATVWMDQTLDRTERTGSSGLNSSYAVLETFVRAMANTLFLTFKIRAIQSSVCLHRLACPLQRGKTRFEPTIRSGLNLSWSLNFFHFFARSLESANKTFSLVQSSSPGNCGCCVLASSNFSASKSTSSSLNSARLVLTVQATSGFCSRSHSRSSLNSTKFSLLRLVTRLLCVQ